MLTDSNQWDAEYAFGMHEGEDTGVYKMPPRKGPPGVTFRETLGPFYAYKSPTEILEIIQTASKEWAGNTYHVLNRYPMLHWTK